MFNCECGAELIQDDCETILDVCQEAPVVKDYETLANKPQINGVTLDGNKTSEDLGITKEIADAVSAEATLREDADTALGGRIDDEATAREDADTALGGRIDGEITNRTNADNALGTRIDNEILARQGGDNNLQTQIDAITSKSDVVDVVADYASLQAYDTQHLGNNDVIKVLDDETHDDAQTYYRWNKTAGTWSYIGSEAPYYSKGQMDTMLQDKQDKLIAGANIQIAQDGKTISATDTTYTAGNGLNLNSTEFSADTTVLATKSDLDSYYTKTETDTKLAPKLEAELVAELPPTGTEGKLYLTPKNYTTGTATGNPITISLSDDAGQLESFQLDGDTFQQTYTGKNLFNADTETLAFIDSNGNIIAGSTWSCSYYIKVSPNTAYAWHGEQTGSLGGQVIWAGYDSSQAFISGQYAQVNNTAGTSFTTGASTEYVRVGYRNDRLEKMQLELGSTATSYEPFVGGQPSPNPDYPQAIQTVTGEQTVEIVGKNLIDPDGLELGNIDASGNDSASQQVVRSGYIRVAAGSYTLKVNNSENNINLWRYAIYDNSKTFVSANTPQAKSATITIANNGYIRVSFYNVPWKDLTVQEIIGSQVQLELGSTATTYAPYHATSYPISLGTIELCKLGTYRDYIYKDGEDWKVHKATSFHQIESSSVGAWTNYSNIEYATIQKSQDYKGYETWDGADVISDHATFDRGSGLQWLDNADRVGKIIVNASITNYWIGFIKGTSLDSMKSSLDGAKILYPLATPTDTVITDTTLIAQLEAIRTASLENGTNTITNTATGSNLAGDMELGYYEYNPTNRYDKWLWLDINNNYEKLGS